MIAIQPPPAARYVVQPGDNLNTIAARSGTAWQLTGSAGRTVRPGLVFPGQASTTRRGDVSFLGVLSLAVLTPAASAQAATAAGALTPAALTPAARLGPGQLQVVFRSMAVKATVYTVRPGDTLSGISAKLFGNPDKWPWLYDANRRAIGANPDMIVPGEKLGETLGSKPEYGDAVAAVDRARQASAGYKAIVASSSSYQPAYSDVSSAVNVNPYGYGGVEGCIVARESGGDSQVMNSSGHYGLFQFDYSTWVSGGGSPASFGHASVAEQQQVFEAVFAARGVEPWGPSDGC